MFSMYVLGAAFCQQIQIYQKLYIEVEFDVRYFQWYVSMALLGQQPIIQIQFLRKFTLV